MSDFKRSKKDNDIMYKVLLKMIDEYLKNGISILLSQAFYSEDRYFEFMKVAKKHKCRVLHYKLVASRQELLKRIGKRPVAKGANKLVPKTRILNNLRRYEKVFIPGPVIIDTESLRPEDVVKVILRDIKR